MLSISLPFHPLFISMTGLTVYWLVSVLCVSCDVSVCPKRLEHFATLSRGDTRQLNELSEAFVLKQRQEIPKGWQI